MYWYENGGPFLVGLIVFYLSAGFFVVFFTTGFMDLSYRMNVPQLWAGIGRADNNLCAVLIGPISLAVVKMGNCLLISIIALALFVLISIAMFSYSILYKEHDDGTKEKEGQSGEGEEADLRFERFAECFALTPRERDVLKILLVSDDNVQDIAEQLFISRAALYRHITCLNEKTETKSRIGLVMNYVLERMKKSRMLALFLVLSMVLSLMPVNMASATEGEETTTCSLRFSASDLKNADITYQLGTESVIALDAEYADEGGAIWVQNIANNTAITIQVTPKQESQISGVNVKEDSSEGSEAYQGNCTSNEDGSYTYTFTASGGRTYYVVLNTRNNIPGGEPAKNGDILIETSEAQNGKVFYSFDGQRLQQTPLP